MRVFHIFFQENNTQNEFIINSTDIQSYNYYKSTIINRIFAHHHHTAITSENFQAHSTVYGSPSRTVTFNTRRNNDASSRATKARRESAKIDGSHCSRQWHRRPLVVSRAIVVAIIIFAITICTRRDSDAWPTLVQRTHYVRCILLHSVFVHEIFCGILCDNFFV